MSSLSEAEWVRKGYHPEYGEIMLDGILDSYIDHGDAHLRQIQSVIDGMPK